MPDDTKEAPVPAAFLSYMFGQDVISMLLNGIARGVPVVRFMPRLFNQPREDSMIYFEPCVVDVGARDVAAMVAGVCIDSADAEKEADDAAARHTWEVMAAAGQGRTVTILHCLSHATSFIDFYNKSVEGLEELQGLEPVLSLQFATNSRLVDLEQNKRLLATLLLVNYAALAKMIGIKQP